MFFCTLAPVAVYRIGHGLKRVKRNADGQRQIQQGNAAAKQPVDSADQEITVLKETQNSQINDDGGDQQSFSRSFAPVFIYQPSVNIV